MKPWYRSKTLWKAGIKIILALVTAVTGYVIEVPEATIVAVLTAIDGLFDVKLRLVTDEKVALRNPPRFDPLDEHVEGLDIHNDTL